MRSFHLDDVVTSILLLLLPLGLAFIPAIYQILTTTSFIKYLLRTIKITQFSYRLLPYLLSSKSTYVQLVRTFLWDSWLRWKGRSWLWVVGRVLKELARWAGIPQELFDVVEECVWGGWCLGMENGQWPTKTVQANATLVVGGVVEALILR